MGSQARTRIALACLLLVTLFAFREVMGEGEYPGPALLGMALAIGYAMAARRRGWPIAITLVEEGVLLVWYLLLVFQTDKTLYGLPTPRALVGLGGQLRDAYQASLVDYAPVPVRPGYVAALVVGMWLIATVGEVATFRLRRPLLASIGPIVLFSLTMVVGTRIGSWLLVLVFVTALLTYWGLESAHRLRSWGRWVSVWDHHEGDEPAEVTGTIARRMAATCLALAAVVPVFLPALNEGLLSWRSGVGSGLGTGGGGGGGTQIDPLVSIVPQLITQSDQALFSVSASRPYYWRLVSLGKFDGESWLPVGGERLLVEKAVRTHDIPSSRASELKQRYDIMDLEGELLPAAVHPISIDYSGDDPLTTNNEFTGDLRVEEGLNNALNYEVVSLTPDLNLSLLKEAEVGDPGPLYLEIPGDLSPEVLSLLEEWTGDADTPIDKLVAIQDSLRAFDYSTDVEASASKDYLTEFLITTRIGYCQQFATAFAVLARQLGYPARVSVGFLPGEADPNTADRYTVHGTDAHAWPEVYFEGYGWIAFEPTPRAAAVPPAYTVPENIPPRPDQNAPGRPGPGRLNPDREGVAPRVPAAVDETGTGPEGSGGVIDERWRRNFSLVLRAALWAALIYLLLVPLLKMTAITLRYRRARDGTELALAAFDHFERIAGDVAFARRESESATTYVRRLAAKKRIPEPDGLALAALVDAARFGRGTLSNELGDEAKNAAYSLQRILWSSSTVSEKVAALFSGGSLVSRYKKPPRRPLRRGPAPA